MRGLDGQLSDLFLHRLNLLLAVVHRFLGGIDRLPGGGVIHAVKGLALGDLVPLLDIQLQNRAGAWGHGGRFVGFGHTAALHLHLDGAHLNGVGHSLAHLFVLLPEHKIPQRHRHRGNDRHGDQQTHHQLQLPFSFFLPGARGRRRRRGLDRLLQHRCLLIRHIDLLLVHSLSTAILAYRLR